MVVVPLCIAVIFMLLYIKFRSPSAMLSVFLAIPFAFIGGMWMQWLMQYVPPTLGGGYAIKYSTAVWVGYIALFGVAVEDGIVLIEYLLERVRGGESIDEATVNAGLLRVRPIIMTTATTVLALTPIMLSEISTTTGAELMKPIAVPTFGGMVTCTTTNLILVPVLFSLFYRVESWVSQRRQKEDEESFELEVTSDTDEVISNAKIADKATSEVDVIDEVTSKTDTADKPTSEEEIVSTEDEKTTEFDVHKLNDGESKAESEEKSIRKNEQENP